MFDKPDPRRLIPSLEVQEAWRMAFAQNIATNGRVFSILLVLICLALYQGGAGKVFVAWAVFAALPVGLSCIADQLPRTGGMCISILAYVISATVAIRLIASTFG